MGPQCPVGQQDSWLASGSLLASGMGFSASLWTGPSRRWKWFSVFESSSTEAMTCTSEGCDFTRTKTLLALWPHPSKTQGRKAEAPQSLMTGLAGRAQARGLSSESGTCPIYLRVG